MKRVVIANGIRKEYTLIRSQRKNVLMKVMPGGEIRVWAPTYSHLRDVDDAVRNHMGELLNIEKQLENTLAENRLKHPVKEGSTVCIEGKPYLLHRVKAGRVSLKISGDECVLALSEPEDEAAVRAALKQALAKLALTKIAERLAIHAPAMGVKYGRVAVRDQKTRWGSCSSKHNLNFNWKLIMAPPEALDYVVIHELCHLIEFNHSPRFWSLVERRMPEYKYWVKWLKDHGKELGVGE